MRLSVTTQIKVARPPAEVFEAWVDPAKMSGYFISRGSARMEPGKTVTWRWDDYNAEGPVRVLQVDAPRHLKFSWPNPAAVGGEATVDVEFIAVGTDATLVKLLSEGWENTADGIAGYGDQLQGWVNMLTCLKAYLEHGINLRKDNQRH